MLQIINVSNFGLINDFFTQTHRKKFKGVISENVAAMEWEHHTQSTYIEMFYSKIDKLEDPNEMVHCPAGK